MKSGFSVKEETVITNPTAVIEPPDGERMHLSVLRLFGLLGI